MKFNPGKCEVIHITIKHKVISSTSIRCCPLWRPRIWLFWSFVASDHESCTCRTVMSYMYTIHGQTLQKTNKAKYVGVTIDSTLSWNPHVEAKSKKAINTVAFFRNLLSCPKRSWSYLLQVSSLATAQVRCFYLGSSYKVQHQLARSCSTRATATTSARAALQVCSKT